MKWLQIVRIVPRPHRPPHLRPPRRVNRGMCRATPEWTVDRAGMVTIGMYRASSLTHLGRGRGAKAYTWGNAGEAGI